MWPTKEAADRWAQENPDMPESSLIRIYKSTRIPAGQYISERFAERLKWDQNTLVRLMRSEFILKLVYAS